MIGDYGIQYTINELGTAAEHKLPLVILMWNNDALGQIRDDMVKKGIQPNAVTLDESGFPGARQSLWLRCREAGLAQGAAPGHQARARQGRRPDAHRNDAAHGAVTHG